MATNHERGNVNAAAPAQVHPRGPNASARVALRRGSTRRTAEVRIRLLTIRNSTSAHPGEFGRREWAMNPVDLANLPALLPVPEAARMLGIARSSAYRLAAVGELPSKRLGHRTYIVIAALREFLEVS